MSLGQRKRSADGQHMERLTSARSGLEEKGSQGDPEGVRTEQVPAGQTG